MFSARHLYVTEPDGNRSRAGMISPPRVGRPRDPALDDQIVTATVRLLGRHGYAGVSMETIAAEAGVTKPTIYRRWPSKAVLVTDALERRRGAMTTHGGHDTLRGDLLAMVLDGYRALVSDSGVILGVAFAARTDRDLAAAIETRVDQDTHTRIQALIERAVARGEVAADSTDTRFLLQTIAAVLQGLMFRPAPDDPQFLTRVVDELIIPALAPATPQPTPGASLHDQEPLR